MRTRRFKIPAHNAHRLINCRSHGAALPGALGLLMVGIVVLLIAYYSLGQIVPPGFMGVRQWTTGPFQGYSVKATRPGLHLSIPFLLKVHLVPETIQQLDFQRPEQGAAEAVTGNVLEIRANDGVSVELDVSVLTRFHETPGDTHGGPADLFQRVGISHDDWQNQIRRVAADELRQGLGGLLAREFYENPEKRQAALNRAREKMAARLGPLGIKVEDVLLSRYTYVDDRMDEAIFNKNLQEQEERLKEASSKLAEAEAKLEQVAAEWDARIETLKITGENAAQVMNSEAKLYEDKKRAEADLLVAKAIAEIDRLRASALAQSSGAQIYVARELAPILASLKGGVVTGLDPYDMEGWIKRFGIDAGLVKRPATGGGSVPPLSSTSTTDSRGE